MITEPDDGDQTVDRTPVITGTGAPGATVTVREARTVICTAVVRANGTWTCTPAAALGLGSHTLRATQTLGGRTSGASAPVTFRIVVNGADNGDDGDAGDDGDNGGLPDTGGSSNALLYGAAGLALLLTGLGITAAHRRSLRD